ncbi:acyl-CoA carboxylase subunit epsilon [Labedaea rhizosphaerae]|uniref:Acyl-CoA carboxylase epsilon subunit-like protein n=1 Tax=Labedaea rhizosphaerae TaxID=598644 RepID=A0A4R6S367_LABRH|nr:acyl-CoA carboxylase subunit epsilon [Labedaea rhizosphaerae]TDP93654.1 acyl-CoA carboxylase epsilon subunit-like protein [Labedaea rhizosphaerae]
MSGEKPVLRVVRGTPDDLELAALTAVVASLRTPEPETEQAPPSRWADKASLMRHPLPKGPGAWRASALPR